MRGNNALLSMAPDRWEFEVYPIEEVDGELERLLRIDARPLPAVPRPRQRLRAVVARRPEPEPEPERLPVFYGPPPPPPPPPVPSADWLLSPDERLRRAF